MRYREWDVVLFPETSNVPQQEFKIDCHVTPDPDLVQVRTITPQGLVSQRTVPAQVPTLTCFIPNLPLGSPFRISVHSWKPPVPSFATFIDSVVYFEARVIIDGIGVKSLLMSQRCTWPQIMQTTSQPDQFGNAELLRFPHFYEQLLMQRLWNPDEYMGRIKVIISEGFMRGRRTPYFERMTNIVTFSFQHAPLEVLEDCGVAWPNPGMWYPDPQHSYGVTMPRQLEVGHSGAHGYFPSFRDIPNDNLHIHSATAMAPLGNSHTLSAQPALGISGQPLNDIIWRPLSPLFMPDPSLDDNMDQKPVLSTKYESFDDLAVPHHFSSPSTTTTTQNVANHNYSEVPVSWQLTPTTRRFEEWMASFPHDEDEAFALADMGITNPADTPPLHQQIFAPDELGAGLYHHEQPRAVPVTTRDPPPPGIREPSDVSMSWGQSETLEPTGTPVGMVKRKPTLKIRSKKEGVALSRKKRVVEAAAGAETVEKKESQEGPIDRREGKRKRSKALTALPPMNANENGSLSPTRKVSRVDGKEADMQGLEVLDDIVWPPLEVLDDTE